MGEAVLSGEEMGLSNMAAAEEVREGGSGSVVKWERFLPRMSLRVLLVEADDSTRQIISALLRKCSYRVASVADGLKAWEILKARPNEIDFILTEVELPSISGCALLTLIMEHEICKNIPVIMMSSQDSVSTVYNCMLRGAADYLVKPIRRNELRNLWQHVWRRQSQVSSGANQAQMESEAERKVECTFENNDACNDSSSYTGSVQRNTERVEEGSEAIPGSAEGSYKHANTAPSKNMESESRGRDANIASEASDNNDELVNSGREAIDLIGAFNNYQSCSSKNTLSANKFDSSPKLDLSLKRSHSSTFEFENQVTEKRHMIKHSDASAFSRYTSKPLKHLPATQTCDRIRENESGAETCSPVLTSQHNTLSLATDLSEQSDVPLSRSQQRAFPVPVAVREVKYNNISSTYSPALPSIFCTRSLPSPSPSPSSANHQGYVIQVNSGQQFTKHGQNVNNGTNHNQERGMEFSEERRHGSVPTDQSGSSSFCNGATSHLNSIGYGSISGSNSNADQVAAAAARTAGENKNEEGLSSQGGNSNRSLQREAALTKFRMKRKDRCFEKKVRYESRKKLAEQRPRVKGQFVRQVQSDGPPAESENQLASSLDG